ncbi:MAG: lysophospholipid acyltransferase family protein [Actinomycetes bacterium]
MEHRDAGKMQVAARLLLTPPFRYLWNVTTEGLENVPAQGAAIIAPNHISVLDSFFVPLCLGRRMTYVGKAEYMDDWKTKFVFPAIGMIPIDRAGGDSAQRALTAAARVLTAGELFGIYPEGTRARDGLLHKGHTGIARLALRTNSPIVPVGIVGSDLVQPADSKIPKFFRRVHLRFGKPISVEKYLDRANDRLVLRQITDEVMYEIRNLSGQDYVNTYATKPVPSAIPESQDESVERLAEVVDLPVRRTAKQSGVTPTKPTVVVASAASERPLSIMIEADGVDRRSSTAAIKTRKLELPFELELSTA